MKLLKLLKLRLHYSCEYKAWRAYRRGKENLNMRRGAGYYARRDHEGDVVEVNMESGKTMVARVLNVKMFSDPQDMTERIEYHRIGYKGEKHFKEMTFLEFLKSFASKDL